MRPIDANALIKTIDSHCYPVQHDMTSIEPGMTRIGILQAIQEQPTIEPERKKGKWVMDGEKCGELMWRCSECRVSEAVPTATSFVSGIVYPQWKYCPNCGVNMMEEGDHE